MDVQVYLQFSVVIRRTAVRRICRRRRRRNRGVEWRRSLRGEPRISGRGAECSIWTRPSINSAGKYVKCVSLIFFLGSEKRYFISLVCDDFRYRPLLTRNDSRESKHCAWRSRTSPSWGSCSVSSQVVRNRNTYHESITCRIESLPCLSKRWCSWVDTGRCWNH